MSKVVATAPWDEINLEAGEWHVPASRMMKMRRDHIGLAVLGAVTLQQANFDALDIGGQIGARLEASRFSSTRWNAPPATRLRSADSSTVLRAST